MNKISLSTRLKYYKRPEIQAALVAAAKDKEVAVRFAQGGYGKRPDSLNYPTDVLEFAKKGVTSFHCSEELWEDPLRLGPKLSRKDQEELRIGWDLVLDIDCKEIEFAKITAVLLIDALEYHGVKTISIKYSGNNGFHLGVPFEAFPKKVNDIPIKKFFPDGARKIAGLLKEMIREPLSIEILKRFTLDKLQEITGKKFNELVKNKKFNPYAILEIDTILISPRHLYRMPYSLHEKSGYASIPITKDQIMSFQKTDALPEKVQPKGIFMDRKQAQPEEAKKLLLQALDFKVKEEVVHEDRLKKNYQQVDFTGFETPEELFPPCMKNIFKGLEDGKKRALFVLLNFLSNVGWGYDKIEARLNEWNKQNPDPLREVILLGQLRHHKQNKKKVLPPNCDNKAYYLDLQVCTPDALCKKIKNPLSYALRKAFYFQKIQEREKKKEVNQANKEGKKQEKEEKKDNRMDSVNQVNTSKHPSNYTHPPQ